MGKKATARKAQSEPEQAPDGELTATKQAALAALLECKTVAEACEKSGISRATIWRYMQEPEFERRLRQGRREIVAHAVLRLQHAADDAVGVLYSLMNSADVGGSVRVKAACAILDYSLKTIENDELRQKIVELEDFILKRQEEDALDRGQKTENDEGD